MTPMRRRFAEEFLIDFHATAAASRAGFSARTARQAGHRLLRVEAVAALIEAGQARLREKNAATVDRVVEELRRLAFSDLGVFFDANGNLRPLKDLTEEERAALASVKVVTRPIAGGEKGDVEYVHEVRLWDKVKALETLARHLGMLLDRTKVEGKIALAPLTPEQAAKLSTADLEQIVAIARRVQGEGQGESTSGTTRA
jgi:phage terminase small subunit